MKKKCVNRMDYTVSNWWGLHSKYLRLWGDVLPLVWGPCRHHRRLVKLQQWI